MRLSNYLVLNLFIAAYSFAGVEDKTVASFSLNRANIHEFAGEVSKQFEVNVVVIMPKNGGARTSILNGKVALKDILNSGTRRFAKDLTWQIVDDSVVIAPKTFYSDKQHELNKKLPRVKLVGSLSVVLQGIVRKVQPKKMAVMSYMKEEAELTEIELEKENVTLLQVIAAATSQSKTCFVTYQDGWLNLRSNKRKKHPVMQLTSPSLTSQAELEALSKNWEADQ